MGTAVRVGRIRGRRTATALAGVLGVSDERQTHTHRHYGVMVLARAARLRGHYTPEISTARVGTSRRKSLLVRVNMIETAFFDEELLPIHERVVDKLADILFASDMILDMLRSERSMNIAPHLTGLEPSVRRVYDQINDLMKQLTD